MGISRVLVFFITLTLSACSGGGGSTSSSPKKPTTTTPITTISSSSSAVSSTPTSSSSSLSSVSSSNSSSSSLSSSSTTSSSSNNSSTLACVVQAGGCDVVLSPHTDGSFTLDGRNISATQHAGKTVCIPSRTQPYLYFWMYQTGGTETKPVKITNCGGQVVFKKNTPGSIVTLEQANYVRFTGTGSSQHKYGFLLQHTLDAAPAQASGHAFTAQPGSSDIEVDHIEIRNNPLTTWESINYTFTVSGSSYTRTYSRPVMSGGLGIAVETYPRCSDGMWRYGTWEMKNIKIHDNYIRNTRLEGIYVGPSHFGTVNVAGYGTVGFCTNTAITYYEAAGRNVTIENNIIENIGNDAMQAGGVVENLLIRNNTIKNFGMNLDESHATGIQIGNGSKATVENNHIETNIPYRTQGIKHAGLDGTIYRDNTIIGARVGLSILKQTDVLIGLPNGKAYFYNNTVTNTSEEAIGVFCSLLGQVVLENNVFNGYGVQYYKGSGNINCLNSDIQTTNTFAPIYNPNLNTLAPLNPNASGVAKVGLAEYSVFYLNTVGKLSAIGGNTLGEIGTTAEYAHTPQAMNFPSGTTIVDVSGGLHQSVALDSNSNVWVWGAFLTSGNPAGGGSTDRRVPYKITRDSAGNSFTNVVSVYAGPSINAAIKADGTLWVWGDTSGGLLGNGSSGTQWTEYPTKISIPANLLVKQFSQGTVAYALTQGGSVFTWGGGGGYQSRRNLGLSYSGIDNVDYTKPQAVTFPWEYHPSYPTEIKSMAISGSGANLFLTAHGRIYGFGFHGELLGQGTGASNAAVNLPTPKHITADLGISSSVSKISASSGAFHAILANGQLWGWGDAAQGEVGNGQQIDWSRPYGCENNNTCDVANPGGGGGPYKWDWGIGELIVFKAERILPNVDNIANIFTGNAAAFYVYAQDSEGKLYSWGRNKTGNLGNGIIGANSTQGAVLPNSWDVPLATYVNPLGLTGYTLTDSPFCVLHPTSTACH